MLHFQECDVTAIKSISQRSLAVHWKRAAKDAPLPAFEAFQPSSRAYDPNWLAIWRVEEDGSGRVFRGLFQGEFIAKAFRSRWEGRSMEDVVPAALRAPALAAANYCVDRQRAIYMVYSTTDQQGRRMDCERMLLPFGDRLSGVKQIIASMEPISLDGDISLDIALDDFVARATVGFAGWFVASPDPTHDRRLQFRRPPSQRRGKLN